MPSGHAPNPKLSMKVGSAFLGKRKMKKWRIIWLNVNGSDVAHGEATAPDANAVAHMIDSGEIKKPSAHIKGFEIHEKINYARD